MIANQLESCHFAIKDVATCDFSQLKQLSNSDVLSSIGKKPDERLVTFIEKGMGIKQRFWCQENQNAYHLAHSALSQLIEKTPSLIEDADFLIYAGISSPFPVTTLSARLGGEFGFKTASCWDLKSGCSTALLALQQGIALLNSGAKNGIIVAAENLSRFANPDILQMAMAIGDGAVALHINNEAQWQVKSSVHGSDTKYSSYMRVNGEFPYDPENYVAEDYYFSFSNKPEGIEKLTHYWQQSLQDLLQEAGISGENVNHYIAHQVDATKNSAIASSASIPESSVSINFENYGNMGCPTIFINYSSWVTQNGIRINENDHLVFHAVGGGISWAGICAQRLP